MRRSVSLVWDARPRKASGRKRAVTGVAVGHDGRAGRHQAGRLPDLSLPRLVITARGLDEIHALIRSAGELGNRDSAARASSERLFSEVAALLATVRRCALQPLLGLGPTYELHARPDTELDV